MHATQKKLAVLAATVIPLTGFAAFGVEAAGASTPLLRCTAVNGNVSFNGGSTGISLSSNAGQTAEVLAEATAGATPITINKLAIAGQTFSAWFHRNVHRVD